MQILGRLVAGGLNGPRKDLCGPVLRQSRKISRGRRGGVRKINSGGDCGGRGVRPFLRSSNYKFWGGGFLIEKRFQTSTDLIGK